MTPQHHPAQFAAQSGEAPDFFAYRERAHRERTRAINRAVASLWDRVTGRRKQRDWDARFWNA